eukprot:gene6860-12459_t
MKPKVHEDRKIPKPFIPVVEYCPFREQQQQQNNQCFQYGGVYQNDKELSMMERTGMILQEHWLDSSDGKELFASILRRNRRRIFGLIETPNLPPKVNIEEVSYKIFLLGKAGVGKTSLVSKLVGTAIPSYHKETPGIQMSVVYWPAKACKENADAVIYTFSLQNRTSWKDLEPLIDPKDSILEEIRNFEQAWKIPVLKIANVDGPMLPDGKSLDGRASIKEIAPFLNNLVSLLWMHDQTADEALKRSSAVITMTSSTSSGKSKISQSGVRMPVDDDYDDRSSNHSSASSSRRSVDVRAALILDDGPILTAETLYAIFHPRHWTLSKYPLKHFGDFRQDGSESFLLAAILTPLAELEPRKLKWIIITPTPIQNMHAVQAGPLKRSLLKLQEYVFLTLMW